LAAFDWTRASSGRTHGAEVRRRSFTTAQAKFQTGSGARRLDTAFEPFVTTEPLGMGMGLSISHAIMESHGGSVRMAHGVGSGATFLFDLPTAEAEASRDAR